MCFWFRRDGEGDLGAPAPRAPSVNLAGAEFSAFALDGDCLCHQSVRQEARLPPGNPKPPSLFNNLYQ